MNSKMTRLDVLLVETGRFESREKAQLAIESGAVKVNGALIYSTCTTEPEENVENIEWFLEQNPNFELEPAEFFLDPDVCKDGYYQTYSHIHHIDGAFAARLIRKN